MMAVFRVYGFRVPGGTSSILIECDSEAVARNQAVREGFTNTTKVELVEGDPGEVDVRVPRRAIQIGRRAPGEDKLRTQPILTIALGVFCGLFLWTLFLFVAMFVLRLLDVAIGN